MEERRVFSILVTPGWDGVLQLRRSNVSDRRSQAGLKGFQHSEVRRLLTPSAEKKEAGCLKEALAPPETCTASGSARLLFSLHRISHALERQQSLSAGPCLTDRQRVQSRVLKTDPEQSLWSI
ncbi:hypothetical protein KUCAC02_006675 [Chaenocephalus aceratus]|uniref:Uncharacterized protein n=1 Tax=Chaenocephalus aceratus TaxID=36190 RepID=A0ACB9VSJ9_CHAAC|nr:hypothetical protein KUCAC02_006675 [Chaenocephalus aceratus]